MKKTYKRSEECRRRERERYHRTESGNPNWKAEKDSSAAYEAMWKRLNAKALAAK